MQLKLIDGLPYSEVSIVYRNQNIIIEKVLVDTGSASTIFSSDLMKNVGISPQPDDPLHTALKLFSVGLLIPFAWVQKKFMILRLRSGVWTMVLRSMVL